MSHNTVKINSNTPDADGAISIPVSSLSDTTISNPQDGDRLDFDGSAWANSAPSGGGGGGVGWIRIGGKDSEVNPVGSSPNTGHNPPNNPHWSVSGSNHPMYIYDAAPVVSSGLTVTFTNNGDDWLSGLTPPTGKYILELQLPLGPNYGVISWGWSSLNAVGVRYHDGSTYHRATAFPIPSYHYDGHRSGAVARGYLDFSSEAFPLEFYCYGSLSHTFLSHNSCSHFTMIKVA